MLLPSVEYVPAGQGSSQLAWLASDWAWPAAHGVQAVAPEDPAIGSGPKLPAGHTPQESGPVRYSPATHGRQFWLSEAEAPAESNMPSALSSTS